jgi:outer membrane protein TolC
MLKKISKTILSWFFLIYPLLSIGQNSPEQTNQLSFDNFLLLVKQYHPIAKQADLVVQTANADILKAKGNFDPKLYYEFRNKFFNSTNYYQLENGGFKIPTWFGLEISGGYEQNNGKYLNSENNTPIDGLLYSKLSLPVLQGLLIDERRNVLKQAKLFQQQSEFEKTNQLNDLLYKAGKTYWEWYLAYNNVTIFKEAILLSDQRLQAIKQSALLGDRPIIDTVEASIQLQDRVVSYQQALLNYQIQSLLLSNFLWMENNVPVEITEQTIPTPYDSDLKNDIYIGSSIQKIDSLINNHPSLKVYEFKLSQLQIEKRYKKDKLKPMLNLDYNPLFESQNLNNPNNLSLNNYKWGVTFGFPVFLRKERGDIQITQIKIDNTQYEALYKKNEITNKVKACINEYNNYKTQLNIYNKNVLDYEHLWMSEKRLFDSGESSLFMINNRETSYINAKIKQNEMVNKKQKAALEAEFIFGELSSRY